jgi:hypothetical protein
MVCQTWHTTTHCATRERLSRASGLALTLLDEVRAETSEGQQRLASMRARGVKVRAMTEAR